jgi:hypothetical protein
LEWNTGQDFKIKYPYTERASNGESIKDVLLKILKPYGLSAEFHRPNSVVEVYSAAEANSRN